MKYYLTFPPEQLADAIDLSGALLNVGVSFRSVETKGTPGGRVISVDGSEGSCGPDMLLAAATRAGLVVWGALEGRPGSQVPR